MISAGGKIGGFGTGLVGRRDRIRTCDLLLPKQASIPKKFSRNSFYLLVITKQHPRMTGHLMTLIPAHVCSRMQTKAGIGGGKIGGLPRVNIPSFWTAISLSRIALNTILSNFTFLKSPVSTSPESGGKMAKRFTDTDKWKRPWFRSLNPKARWVWIYLLDTCENTGVWIADFETMSLHLGFKVSAADLFNWLQDKLIQLEHDKYFIPSFVNFQYGELNPENKAHKPVLKVLEKYASKDLLGSSLQAPSKDLPSPIEGAQDKDKDKELDKARGDARGEVSLADLEQVYASYPLKKGKSKGLKILAREIKTRAQLSDLRLSVANYSLSVQNTEAKFIKHFSTFATEWHDWTDPDAGSSSIQQKSGPQQWLEEQLAKKEVPA